MSNNLGSFQSAPPSAGAADAVIPVVQTNLVSDIAGLAIATDPNLVNPWGVSFFSPAAGPFWISDQGSNVTTLYSVTDSTVVGSPVPVFTVNIPPTGRPAPTGHVSHTDPPSFHLTATGDTSAALFIFADLNGTISAWNPGLGFNGSTAHVEATTPGAVYTGLAVNPAHTILYAANHTARTIALLNTTFAPVTPS